MRNIVNNGSTVIFVWSHLWLLNGWACSATTAADEIFNINKRNLEGSLCGPGNHNRESFSLFEHRDCFAQRKVQPASIIKSLLVQGKLQILNYLITEFCNIKIVSLWSVQITKKVIPHICMQNIFIKNLFKSCRKKWDFDEQVLKQQYMFVGVYAHLCVQVSSVGQYWAFIFYSKAFGSAEKCIAFVIENPCSQLSGKEKEQNLSYSQILNAGVLIRRQNYFQEVSRGEGRKRNCAKGKTWAEY